MQAAGRYHARMMRIHHKGPRSAALLLGLLLLSSPLAAEDAAPRGFVGSAQCAECHSEEYRAWQGSQHDRAMQRPTAETVLGDFENAEFEHFGQRTRFFRRDGEFWVHTDGPDGEARDYPVAWVFGVYPLQQYLLALDRGRLQALSVAWDARPLAEGGQRWYSLYPKESIDHSDPLHWTGPYQNWNTRCAECHSTDVRKGYDAGTGSFDTRFAEEDVACEACHGPGAKHVSRARQGGLTGPGESGLLALRERGVWQFSEDAAIAARSAPPGEARQLDSCGRCHARRGTLGDYRHGQPLAETHRLSLLGSPLYHPDGQILDEVYVLGSFLQSPMHQAGVVCSNCHDPHSLELRAPGDGVCLQCHRSERYAARAHHHHAPDREGARCVNCHMPASTYMGVDPRRDHSLRVPRPDLSVTIGTPNACNGCHEDRDANWALDRLRDWGGATRIARRHPGLAMEAASRGDRRAVADLLAVARDPESPGIWRATALERGALLDARATTNLATAFLQSSTALLRISAVRALASLPLSRRFRLLFALHADPVLGVRMEVAEALAAVPLEQLDASAAAPLRALFDEYLRVQQQHRDMPGVLLQISQFLIDRGDAVAAEIALREALAINAQFLPGQLNLADLLRSLGRDEEAGEVLQQALATAPQSAAALHALGLLDARAGRSDAALQRLGEAAALESAEPRHRYVYAVALHDYGKADAALQVLRRLHRALPADTATLLALVNYSTELERRGDALRYARKLLALEPGDHGYRQLVRELEHQP